jgi:hypothetical protein
MNRNEVEQLLESVYSKSDYEFLFQKAEKEYDFFNLIWEIAKDQPFEKAWRLLWILDHATEKRNDFILPILNDIYSMVLNTENESYIRQGMKLILRCPILEDYAGELLDRCISWMNDPKAKISSQCLGIEFFHKTCMIYPEMAPELIAYIEDILERNPSAGYKVMLKRIRQEFDKK